MLIPADRKLLELANAVEPVQDGRIHIEKINAPFLFKECGSPPSTGPGSHSQSPKAGCGDMNPAPT